MGSSFTICAVPAMEEGAEPQHVHFWVTAAKSYDVTQCPLVLRTACSDLSCEIELVYNGWGERPVHTR